MDVFYTGGRSYWKSNPPYPPLTGGSCFIPPCRGDLFFFYPFVGVLLFYTPLLRGGRGGWFYPLTRGLPFKERGGRIRSRRKGRHPSKGCLKGLL